MIKITKQEAFAMRVLGFEHAVLKTYSDKEVYYLVEESDITRWNPKTKKNEVVKQGALSAYYDYKKDHVIKTVTRDSFK